MRALLILDRCQEMAPWSIFWDEKRKEKVVFASSATLRVVRTYW